MLDFLLFSHYNGTKLPLIIYANNKHFNFKAWIPNNYFDLINYFIKSIKGFMGFKLLKWNIFSDDTHLYEWFVYNLTNSIRLYIHIYMAV